MGIERDWCAPEACSLNPADQPARVAEWDAVFAEGVRAVTPVENGVRLELASAPGRAAAVADLAARESRCCDFFRFDVAVGAESLALTVRADSPHASVVEALAARAVARSSAAQSSVPAE
jgi:hypothetical protein